MERELVLYVRTAYKLLADSQKAKAMAAYMKTDMPFWGIQKPDRLPVYRQIKARFQPSNHQEYCSCVLALWNQPYREEKYTALAYAQMFPKFIGLQSVPLYERLIREGAWWDFVDDIAIHLVGTAQLKERKYVQPLMDQWINNTNLWIRRSALISQIGHKLETDAAQLFSYCLLRAAEKEFFIAKGIGWALRDYSYTQPEAVKRFLLDNRHLLRPLSFREGAQGLIRKNLMTI